jgi:surfeit locus 1 family protein
VGLRIPIGSRVFAPAPAWTVLALAGCALFVSLGRWQWGRYETRSAQWQQFARGTDQVLPLGSRETAALPRYQHVGAEGRYLADRQFLLDNISHDGLPGYEVLTPLELADGRVLLVNRGWIRFSGYRDRLPDIALRGQGPVKVTGRLDDLPATGLASGRVGPPPGGEWPKVASFPKLEQLAAALGRPIEPRVLLLDAGGSDGYLRAWQPPGVSPQTNLSYAVQWWAFAGLAVVLWAILSTRRSESRA